MENIRNQENPVSLIMKENVTSSDAGQQSPKTRGEVAAQEQVRIFRQAFVTSGDIRLPRTRGEVAAQEQMRIAQLATTYKMIEDIKPITRGEVAAQEQTSIFNQVLKMQYT